MNQKPKPCKGIGKAYGFDGCGKETIKRTYGLCDYCYWDYLNNDDRGKVIYQKQFKPKIDKVTEKRKKEKLDIMKKNVTSWNVKLTEKLQEIARIIDYGQPCPARGYVNCQFHGGHVETKGGHFSMKFNLHNIHRQSAQSNNWKNDSDRFKKGLAKEYGQPYIDFIESMVGMSALKYTNEEYRLFYAKACKIASELKSEKVVRTEFERLNARDMINTELGIYEPKYAVYGVG